MFTIPNNMAEPVTRLAIDLPSLFTYLYDSGIYLLYDATDGHGGPNPTAMTDGKGWIRFNQEFMAKLKTGEEGVEGSDVFVLAHEILHCALMHAWWMESVKEHGVLITNALLREIQKFNPRTRWQAGMSISALDNWHLIQQAMDFVINHLLHTWGLKIKPYMVCFDPAIAVFTDSESTAFCRLIGREMVEPPDPNQPSQPKPQPSAGSPQPGPSMPGTGPSMLGPAKPGEGGSDMVESQPGDLTDEDDGEPINPSLDDARRKMSTEALLKALEAELKGRGHEGLGIGRIIDRLLPSKIKWRQMITTEVKHMTGRGFTTWTRLSNRSLALGAALPGQVGKRSGRLLFIDDVSGSVGKVEMAQAAGCIYEAVSQCQPKEIVVLDVDAQVQQVRRPKDAKQLKAMLLNGFKGGGGTRMGAGLDWCKEHKVTPDTIICITDGDTPWPADHAPAKNMLWVITTPGVTAPPACGRSIYMPIG